MSNIFGNNYRERYNLEMNKKLDILAIGDITTDAFIKLQEAEVNCDINKDNCKIYIILT